eukprot:746757-Hanusia_phi.AAC.1
MISGKTLVQRPHRIVDNRLQRSFSSRGANRRSLSPHTPSCPLRPPSTSVPRLSSPFPQLAACADLAQPPSSRLLAFDHGTQATAPALPARWPRSTRRPQAEADEGDDKC